jgi:tellurite resistance protein
MPTLPPALSPQDALVALMVAVSVADSELRTAEMLAIQQLVNQLPVFSGYDIDRVKTVSQTVFDLIEEEDGLDALLGLVRAALPDRLYETAYTLACDVAAADGKLMQAELRLLEDIRHELELDRLHAAAIERAARARFMRV